MEQLYNLTIRLHEAFVGILLLFAIMNFFIINNTLNFDALHKRVKIILPLYYFFLSTIIFTGLILLGVSKFSIQHTVILMIFVWFIIFFMTIRRYKKLKSLRRGDKRRTARFIRFSKRKHLIDASLIIVTMALTYLLK